ncbi:hypothetical protein NC652_025271 [Populus alba x Populus x berolinensis]|nr:hypothetical protein NC652_025271 [Populus alba x Populus x berolinensis]
MRTAQVAKKFMLKIFHDKPAVATHGDWWVSNEHAGENMSSWVPSSPLIAEFSSCPARFISVPPSISSKPHLRSQVPPLYLSGICLSKPFLIKIGATTTQPNPDLLYQTIDLS